MNPSSESLPSVRTVSALGATRRTTIKALSFVGGGLLIGLPRAQAQQSFDLSQWPGRPEQAFEYWLQIAPDNTVTVNLHLAEMGQGIMTAVAMLVAEELEASWQDVRVQFAPNGPAYYNRGYSLPLESTGGSTSIRGAFNHSRAIGAAAREMLRAAAAREWGVPISETRAELGQVFHQSSEQRLTFGSLAEAAAKLAPPQDVLLKPKSQWSIIGRSQKRLDTPAKVDGSAGFGADVQFPGLLTAAVRHCPSYEGRLISVDPAPALAVAGVEQVVELDNAVAVLAQGYWPAQKGLDALTPEWDLGPRAAYGMANLELDLKAGLTLMDAPVIREDGDITAAMNYADSVYEQTFEAPYLAHVCMEPMNATAWVREDAVDVWLPGQGHSIIVDDVSALLAVDKETIRVHRTFLGGGFGRRGESDVAVQAVRLSQSAGGRPVKVLWSREEDVRRDFYRPAAQVHMRFALGEDGLPIGLDVIGASPSISMRRFPAFIKDGKDPGAFSGFLDTPYPFDHQRYRHAMIDNGIPVGYWRSVGHSQNVFFMEAMINELAERAGLNGLEYRRRWLADDPRMMALLDALEEFSGYSDPLPPGQSKGIALNVSHGSLCAHVIHISSGKSSGVSRGFKVERIDCVIDPGVVVNPAGVAAQVESQALDGLSAALFGKVIIENGGTKDGNFDTVRLLRLGEAPEVRVRIVEWDAASPGGLGEPSLPSVAPALTDAIYQATGKRLRSLPVIQHGLDIASA
ncbi:MAG: molybdopterin-dependent oxidoreductase [Rhodospirillaceae bacterium]